MTRRGGTLRPICVLTVHILVFLWLSSLTHNSFTPKVAQTRHRKQCSPSSDVAFLRRRLSWDVTAFCNIQHMPTLLQIMSMYSILCFLKTKIILNIKEVPNTTFQVCSMSFSSIFVCFFLCFWHGVVCAAVCFVVCGVSCMIHTL